MRQELERVNINLKNKADEGNGLGEKLRLCLQENEELRRKIKEV